MKKIEEVMVPPLVPMSWIYSGTFVRVVIVVVVVIFVLVIVRNLMEG